jgi:hypothetical protein
MATQYFHSDMVVVAVRVNDIKRNEVHIWLIRILDWSTYFHSYVCDCQMLDAGWNVMAHAQKPVFVFQRNGRVHLNRRGRQISRLLAAEVCASAVVMLDTPCPEAVCRVPATHSIHQFPLHFTSCVPSHFNWRVPLSEYNTIAVHGFTLLLSVCTWSMKFYFSVLEHIIPVLVIMCTPVIKYI